MPTNSRNATAYGLIGIGVLFLIAQITGFSLMGLLWPLLVVGFGAIFLYFALTGDKNAAGLAVPGAVISGTGAILFYQNMTGHWSSWAYAWVLYPVFVGLALVFIGRRTGSANTEHTGDNMVKWGLVAFTGMWVLFEILIFGGNNWLVSTLLPLALIGAGVYLLIRNNARQKTKIGYSSNGYHKNDDLQEKIKAALAEEDDQTI